VSYTYLISSSHFAFTLEFSKLDKDHFEISNKNVTKTKLQVEALHAEKDALLKVNLLLLVISDGGKSGHAIGNSSMHTS